MAISNQLRQISDASETVWERTDKGVERQILSYDAQTMLVRVRFEKGAIGALHHHPHRQISYVESGLFEVEIEGEKHTLETGSSFLVLPDQIHGVKAIQKGALLDFFSPVREDFL